MIDLEERLLRTWVEDLIENGFDAYAALIVDAKLHFTYSDSFGNDINGLFVILPRENYKKIQENNPIKEILLKSFNFIAEGHIWDDMSDFPVKFKMDLLEVEENWRDVIKRLITISKEVNQGLITEKVFIRESKQPITYNEIKFASQSEVRIAQELEVAEVLFFPLPLAVRYETGNIYEDHREVDFLICHQGTWGILEVAYHPDRYEKDKEKDFWFKKSGILCIEHYPAERCYNRPKDVIDEFLKVLVQYKK
ncbi:hypothetical protein H6G89_29710 [Oscillatoria sp. FACHB-1407]|uniref:hypothetical protein n=1 Tax=Oscillatoria sp. FACHB-1407 TaxID=2692847 RepID=UPI001688B7B0|nr:hypothetical protein [Oscillatoria sp. FACHB-1407]MBD2465189.1 hypothetical protein [Oscillatoria sp. FACHB-1407]